jgi:hypothetical protein
MTLNLVCVETNENIRTGQRRMLLEPETTPQQRQAARVSAVKTGVPVPVTESVSLIVPSISEFSLQPGQAVTVTIEAQS